MAKRKTKAEVAIDNATLEPDELDGPDLGDDARTGPAFADRLMADLDAIGDDDPPAPDPTPEEPAPPDPTSPEWNDYVLSHFLDEEKDPQGRPTNDGLRRVVELLLGPIVGSVPVRYEFPEPGNPDRAISQCEVKIAWGGNLGDIRVFGDLAEVNPDNIGLAKFLPFALTTSYTRSESRAFRKALKLRKVLSADEVPILAGSAAVFTDQPVRGPGGFLSEGQERAIKKTCRDLKIDAMKFIAMGAGKYQSFAEIRHDTASNMMEHIQGFLQKPETIPPGIKLPE